MTIKLAALIVKGTIPRHRGRHSENDYLKTLRFFEGLGKSLSTWEFEMLARAEGGEDEGE